MVKIDTAFSERIKSSRHEVESSLQCVNKIDRMQPYMDRRKKKKEQDNFKSKTLLDTKCRIVKTEFVIQKIFFFNSQNFLYYKKVSSINNRKELQNNYFVKN